MISYFLFRFFVFIFRLTPFWLLYLQSDFIYFLIYHVIAYRKKVVWQNLKNSFPDKSDTELKKITKGFYKNLSDITVESIKGFSMSKKTLLKRYKVLNAEIANKYLAQNKSVIAATSHFANWEWAVLCVSLQFKHKSVGLYKPLSNKYIDNYMKKSRAAWGMNLLSIRNTSKYIEKENTEPSIYFMVSDQSPSNIEKAYWVDFLNQDTACLHGIENYAKKYNLPVVYAHIDRVKRGYYEFSVSMIEPNPKETADGEITRAYMKILEEKIIQKPENWLWSHKRWKKKR